jgi:hypothetical protein
MAGIAGLVAHVDDVVAFFDEVLRETDSRPKHPRRSFAKMQRARRAGRVDTQRTDAWVEPVEGVEGVSVLWTTTGSIVFGRRRPAIAFDGGTPPAWTPARAELETRWSSRDAIVNAVRKATHEGTPDDEVAGRVAEIYGGWLERREELTDGTRLRPLFVEAIRAALGSSHAVAAVEALKHDWRRLFDEDFIDAGFTAAGQWREFRPDFVAALENVRDYADALGHQAEGEGDEGTADADVVEMTDDVHRRIARKIKGKNLAVLLYLYDRNAVSAAEKPAKRELIVEALKPEGITSTDDAKNAIAAIRRFGDQAGLKLVESADCGAWLTPDGRQVASRVARPAGKPVAIARVKAGGG